MVFIDCAQDERRGALVLNVFGRGVVEVFEDDEDADTGDAGARPSEAVNFVDGHIWMLQICAIDAIV